jgi:uncharacterized protein (DUF1778 family)
MSKTRNKRVYIRLTQDEKSRIEAIAEKYGVSISEFVRKVILQPNAIFLEESDRLELRELLTEARTLNRTLNLYHEKRQEHTPFLARVRKFVKQTQ